MHESHYPGPRPATFRGEERGDYDHVEAVAFYRIPVPEQPGNFYSWRHGEVTTWTFAQEACQMALDEGCEAFYFALPNQLVNGTPVDTRLH